MERFRKILDDRHKYAMDWKARTGGKVLGYYEPYMPEELVYAAGVLPVRLLARHEPDDVTDRQMYANCSCSRDILNQFVKGRYEYIDGLINAEGCQWLLNAFQTTLNNKPDLFNHYVFVPDYVDGHSSKNVMHSELKTFKKALEKWTGNSITDQALDHAIEVYNTNRRLLRQIYEMRRLEDPVITGTEAMEMVLTSQVMDKEDHNRLLTEALKELRQRKSSRKEGVRLMLLGSPASDAELESLIESMDATVVIDELCTGSGYFWNEVIPLEDRLMAVSLRYLGKPHCALKDNNWRRRPAHIHQLCEDFNAKGVIIAKQIYCHPHGTDNPEIWNQLREHYIPFHYLERDTTRPGREMQVRLEAFIKMVRETPVLQHK